MAKTYSVSQNLTKHTYMVLYIVIQDIIPLLRFDPPVRLLCIRLDKLPDRLVVATCKCARHVSDQVSLVLVPKVRN